MMLVSPAHQSFAQVANSCALSGKVTDLLGNPLPLSKIQIEDAAKNKFEAEIDQAGNYSVNGFLCGQINAAYSHQGFHIETLEMNLANGTDKIINLGLRVGRLTDTPVIKVKGKILDERKKAFEGARIKLTNIRNERVGSSAMSSANGSFEMVITDEGKYLLEVTAKDKKTYQFEIFVDYMKNQSIKLENIVLNPLTV
jgi:hypothetical protein